MLKREREGKRDNKRGKERDGEERKRGNNRDRGGEERKIG